MAHGLEINKDGTARMAFADREVPWHKLGVRMSGLQTAPEMLRPAQADFDVVCRSRVLFIVTKEDKYIRVDVVGARGIDKHMSSVRNFIQYPTDAGTIEKADLVPQFDPQDVSPDMLLDDPFDRSFEIAVENEPDADGQSNQDSNQEIG